MFIEDDVIFTDIKIHITFGILILIPTDKKGTDHTCHSLCSSASSLIYSFCLLPLSALHLYPSCFCSWNRHFLLMNSGPCQEPVEVEKILPLILKKLQTGPYFSYYLPFLCSSWESHALCHFAVKCIGFFRVWLQITQGKNRFCKLSCIQHRYQMVTASFTPKLDSVWLNWEVQCFSTAQALWCCPVFLVSTLWRLRGKEKIVFTHPD